MNTRLAELQISLSALARHIAFGKLDSAPPALLTRFEAAVAVMTRWVEDPHSRGQVRAVLLRDGERKPMSLEQAVLAALLERVETGKTTEADSKLIEGVRKIIVCTTRSDDCAMCVVGP